MIQVGWYLHTLCLIYLQLCKLFNDGSKVMVFKSFTKTTSVFKIQFQKRDQSKILWWEGICQGLQLMCFTTFLEPNLRWFLFFNYKLLFIEGYLFINTFCFMTWGGTWTDGLYIRISAYCSGHEDDHIFNFYSIRK